MVVRSLLGLVRTNVTAKVCFFVFATSATLLALLGGWYLGSYDREVRRGLAARLALPAALMSDMALTFDAVRDLAVMGRITGEPVVEAFVARRDGVVFYASDPGKVGRPVTQLLPASSLAPAPGNGLERRLLHGTEQGRPWRALVTPLVVGGETAGHLFVKVDASGLAGSQRREAWQVALGVAASVALIVFIAGFWVQRLLVPRISRTVSALEQVKEGRLGTRIGDHGVADQIGLLMRSVDAMIEQVDARDRAVRAAEREYRDLFARAVEGIFRESTDGEMLAANPALALMLGYPSPAELIAGFSEFREGTREFASEWETFVERVRREGEVRDYELRVRRRDGEVLWVALTGRALHDAAGRMTAVEGSALDVSERKRREAAEAERLAAEAARRATAEVLAVLEEKNRQLEQALEQLGRAQERLVLSEKMAAMGTMAAGVAHDLNNILSGVVSYPDLVLAQMPEGSAWREELVEIRDAGLRAAAVVADLLTIARGAAYPTAPCDLNRLVAEHLQSPEHRQLLSRFPRVRVEARLGAGIRCARCSEVHIRKVLMNLVMNACEAVHDEGLVVVATASRALAPGEALSRSVAPGEYVALTVSDTGPGIADKDLPRVFEPFFTKKVLGRSGTGLGLAVVWNTVQEHRGAVAAESDGAGATFAVLLPAAEETGTAPAPADAGARARLHGSESVLVVDDEPQLRLIATRILGALGYEVEAACSGEEGIERVRARPYDLVLLDMLMPPGKNGGETYREMTRIRPGLKAVICSGYALGEDFLETQRIGAGAFLRKPYTLEELGRAVRRELDRRA